MNLAGVIKSLPHDSVTVTRKAAGSYGSDGLYSGGTESTFTIDVIVYPAKAHEIAMLPEGMREMATLGLLTHVPLITATDGGYQADRITYDGQIYEVQHVWSYGLAGTYQNLAVLVEA